MGDANEDGAVDVSDLGILATNYGETGIAAGMVPEPSLFAALFGIFLAGLVTRRAHK